jgi:flagellar basal-body rod protein FlgB
MFVSSITERGATPALVQTWSYTYAQHRMIAENVANWGNPDYKTKHLDASAFQQALRRALDQRGSDPNEPFVMERTAQFRTGDRGQLLVTPTERPLENILFHDRTNMSIERQMADLAENGMMHETVTTLLRGRYEGLRKAIRGRM